MDGCYSYCSWWLQWLLHFFLGWRQLKKRKRNQTKPKLTNPTKHPGCFFFSALEAKMAQFSLGAILPKVVIVKQCNICYAIYGRSGLPQWWSTLRVFLPSVFFSRKKITRFQGIRDLFCRKCWKKLVRHDEKRSPKFYG